MYMKEKLKDKKVIFVPVYSARSYETGKYNLALDGNMARIISKVILSKPKRATILIPENYINLDVWEKALAKYGLDKITNFIPCNAYGHNAHETRMNGMSFAIFLNEYFTLDTFRHYDVAVLEPNTLFINVNPFVEPYVGEIINWCVASKTSVGTPWFVEEFAEIDKYNAKNWTTFCATNSQVEYLGGKSVLDEDGFYQPEYFDFKTIFFPFRLTDKNYHAEEFREIIYRLRNEGYNNFKVLYTDVNDSHIFKDDEVFTKVSGQKEVYLSILKSKPIIPYLEDADTLMHININEFMYYGCKILIRNNKTLECPWFTHFDTPEDFYNKLKDLLMEE